MPMLEIEDGRSKWLGLTDEEWMNLFGTQKWDRVITKSLIDIIWDLDTRAKDRLNALKYLNELCKHEMIKVHEEFPGMVAQVLIFTSLGAFKVPWWRRFGLKRRQRNIRGRLEGILQLMHTASQFFSAAASVPPAPAPKPELEEWVS